MPGVIAGSKVLSGTTMMKGDNGTAETQTLLMLRAMLISNRKIKRDSTRALFLVIDIYPALKFYLKGVSSLSA
jgi:hypothetical protein